jgi:tetratricopeptide (TPR) repeat protein
MRKFFQKTTVLFLISIGLITLDACRKKYYATAENMAEYGWVLYKTKDFLNSNTWFQDAVTNDKNWKDAYNGLGWTYAKLMVLDSSIANYQTGLGKKQDAWNPTDIHSEILAGLTFAYHAQGKDKKTVEFGRTFLDSTVKPLTSGWIFSHDSLLNYLDVRITLAASYFALGKFDSTILQMTVILDSLNSSELPITDTTLIGRIEMAKQIMTLQDYLLSK